MLLIKEESLKRNALKIVKDKLSHDFKRTLFVKNSNLPDEILRGSFARADLIFKAYEELMCYVDQPLKGFSVLNSLKCELHGGKKRKISFYDCLGTAFAFNGNDSESKKILAIFFMLYIELRCQQVRKKRSRAPNPYMWPRDHKKYFDIDFIFDELTREAMPYV